MSFGQSQLRLYPVSDQGAALYEGSEHFQAYMPAGPGQGCTQTLEAQMQGAVRFITGEQEVWHPGPETIKYISRIQCTDTFPVAAHQLGPGTRIGVDCLVRLMTPKLQPGHSFVLPRPAVPGSLWCHGQGGKKAQAALDLDQREAGPLEDAKALSLPDSWPLPRSDYNVKSRTATLSPKGPAAHISYCPRLVMVMVSLSVKAVEWEGLTTWEMVLHEA
jgi:hypothetical protein